MSRDNDQIIFNLLSFDPVMKNPSPANPSNTGE